MSNKPLPLTKGISAKRIILFKGISIILIPLLVLFFAELFLRVINYGNNYSLFVDYSADHNYLVFNPDASKKYFTQQDIATRGNSEIFKKKKAANTIRIFVLGESTTVGYPYFHNGSFHRWLQYRLLHTYPDKNFEIINLSLTAVNSYTVLGFAKEVVNYEPDAVLIYTGHNEYYGALGAASTQSLGSNPQMINFIIGLRDLKLSQLIINTYNQFGKQHKNYDATPGEGRMQMMVAKQEVPLHSELYKKGLSQFTYNMDHIMKLFAGHHIPLFVSNLVSNEKDLKPFISAEPSHDMAGFKSALIQGIKAYDNKKFDLAAGYLQKANHQYNSSALCNYYLGKIAYGQGDFKLAKKYLTTAKDLDELRFRAPEAFNQTIAALVKKYPGVHLVDTETAFEVSDEHHIIGDNLTVDHVHPNLQGYAIMSDVFYRAIKAYRVVSKNGAQDLTFKQLLHNMPPNEIDSAAGTYRALNLKGKWPYHDSHSMDKIQLKNYADTLGYQLVFQNKRWDDVMNNLYAYYIKNHQLIKARNVLENLSLEYPADAGLYERLGMLSGELHDDANILFYFKKSFDLLPDFEKSRYLFVNYLKNDKPAEALTYINYAINNNSSGFDLLPVKNYTERIIRLQQQYGHDSGNVPALLEIANLYRQMGNRDAGLKYAQKVLKIDAGNKTALQLFSQKENQTNR
jgi:lysophospholipase L1-like esterase